MADISQTHEPQRGLSFDDVWAALMELRESQMELRESQRESLMELRESQRVSLMELRESQRVSLMELRESQKETDRRMKETDRQIGELGNRFGELAEHLVAPNIKEKFNALGYHFDDISQNREIDCPDGSSAEIDILLENTEFSIAVEVKSKPTERDVKEHAKRIETLRKHKDRRRDTRKIRGAVAGAIVSKPVRNYILKNGFYLIEQSGDTVKIDIPEGFVPREW